MHSFYIGERARIGQIAHLPAEEARHAARVLRTKVGDEVCALDGHGRYLARITAISDKSAQVCIVAELPSNEAPVKLTVYQGIAKSDKLELIVQKLAELGANSLIPIRMARSVAKLDGAAKADRLAKIAREASKQCRRAGQMRVGEATELKDALPMMRAHNLLIVPWEMEGIVRMRDVHAQFPGAADIGIVIGPEGGIAPEEIEMMIGARCVTLGSRILRAETAAIAASALVMALWGDI